MHLIWQGYINMKAVNVATEALCVYVRVSVLVNQLASPNINSSEIFFWQNIKHSLWHLSKHSLFSNRTDGWSLSVSKNVQNRMVF